MGPGAVLVASIPLASIITHLIVANHKRSLNLASKTQAGCANDEEDEDWQAPEGSSASAATLAQGSLDPSREILFPFQSLGLHVPVLDSAFELWDNCMGIAVSYVSSTAIVIAICLPLCTFFFLRIMASRLGIKVSSYLLL